MKKYIKYLMYLLRHKKNVFKICMKRGMYIHAITHDMSRFRPKEFIPYARHFYGIYPQRATTLSLPRLNYKGPYQDDIKREFLKAWEEHYTKNKHHEEHWIKNGFVSPMPEKYVDQMLADWSARSIEFGGTAEEYYLKSYNDKELHKSTRLMIEKKLGLIDKDSSFVLYETVRLTKNKNKLKALDDFIEKVSGVKEFSKSIKGI